MIWYRMQIINTVLFTPFVIRCSIKDENALLKRRCTKNTECHVAFCLYERTPGSSLWYCYYYSAFIEKVSHQKRLKLILDILLKNLLNFRGREQGFMQSSILRGKEGVGELTITGRGIQGDAHKALFMSPHHKRDFLSQSYL